MRLSVTTLVSTALLLGLSPARADTPEARGRRLFEQQRYADAIAAFREAADRPGQVGYDFTCEIGLCYARLDDHARAHFYLGLCRDDATWARWEKPASRALAAAEAAMRAAEYARVRVEVSPTDAIARFDALDDVGFGVPREVWLPVGSHTLTAHAEGHQGVEQQVILYGRDPVTVALDLEPTRVERSGSQPETVDFAEEEPFEETAAGDLPDVEHDTLLPKRFRGGGAWRGGDRGTGSRLSPGLKVGAGVARLVGDDAPEVGARVGVSVLAFLTYRIAGRFALQPEIGWVRAGAEGRALDFLAVPVLAVYALPLGPVSARLALGPALDFSLGATLDGREVATFELAAVASAEARFPCGVVLEVRYAHGLTTLDSGSAAGEISTSAVTVLGGYAF